MKLTNNELKMVIAGATISSSLINSFFKGVNALLDIGRYLGSSIRRITEKSICPF